MFDFTNLFSGLKSGDGNVSGMGFITEIFKSFGKPGASASQEDKDTGSSSSFFKDMMNSGPFGNIGAMFNMVIGGFLGPFAQIFKQLTNSFQAPEARKEFRAYGIDIDFKEELLSEVPEALREPFLAVHAQLKAKDKQRVDGELEVLLADKTLSAFEKRARFRQLMVSDLTNCDGVSPDAAEALETACMEDFGVNKEEDIDALASNLVELSRIRAKGKEHMSPLAKVQAGNYDKTIDRFERAIQEHEVKVRRIREDIITKMIELNPEGRFNGHQRAELEAHADSWVAFALERIGDVPDGLEGCDFNFRDIGHVDMTLRGAGKGLGLNYLGHNLVAIQEQLEQYKRSYRDAAVEYMSEEQQERQGFIHAKIRHAKVSKSFKAVNEQLEALARSRADVVARLDAILGDDEESQRYKASYRGEIEAIDAKIARRERHVGVLMSHLEALEGIRTELAYQEEKQRFDDEEALRVESAKREIEDAGGDVAEVVDLREVIRKGAKRDEAMAILDGARDLDKGVGTADRISAKDMMLRLGKLEENLGRARRLNTKREELRVLIRRMEHKLSGSIPTDIRAELEVKIAASKEELRKEEQRLNRLQQETRGASNVFGSMREKDKVIHDALTSKKLQAREVFRTLDGKLVSINEKLGARVGELRLSGFDLEYCSAQKEALDAVFHQDGTGAQRGTLMDTMRAFKNKEQEEKDGRLVLEREIRDIKARMEIIATDLREGRGGREEHLRDLRDFERETQERYIAIKALEDATEAARVEYQKQVDKYKKLNPLAQVHNARKKVSDAYERDRREIDERVVRVRELIEQLDDGELREQAERLNHLSRELRELMPKLEKYGLTCEDLLDKDAVLLQAQLKVQGMGAMSMEDILSVPQRDVAAPARLR